jgi:hypothetical protein
MLMMTEKRGVCWHCHQPIAFFRPTQQSWIEANGAQRVRLSERWLHTDEEQPYEKCKVNGFHPGAGSTVASASPQSSLVKIVVAVTIVLFVLVAFLVYAYSGVATPA